MMTYQSIRASGIGGVSRRDMLRLAGAGGVAGLLASCGGDDDSSSAPSPGPADTPSPGEAGEGPQLPTEDVELRFLSGPDSAAFWEPWLDRYHDEHPNITVEFDGVADPEVKDVVSLGVQNGNAHDVFKTPRGIPDVTMVNEGWVAPLDEWIPNVEEWKSRFLPHALARSVFDGKLYNVPLNVSVGVVNMLFYNRAILNDAGYDPQTEPLSWDDLREAARKVTEAGGGDVYGLVIAGGQGGRLASWVQELAMYAGSGTTGLNGGAFDWLAGEYRLTTDEHFGAAELMLALIDDGSVLPGSAGLNPPEANAALSQGSAAMILNLPNVASLWPRGQAGGSPDFDFGVGQPPAVDPDNLVPVGAAPGGPLRFWAYADSPNLAVIGDMFSRIGSPEVVTEYFQTFGLANKPAFDGVLEQVDWTDVEQQTIDILNQIHVTAPSPAIRNPDFESAQLGWKAPQPDLGTMMQGVLAGEVDYQEGLQTLEDALNTALDDMISAAQGEGLEISREDFVFPNWDPTQDYTPEMYEEL